VERRRLTNGDTIEGTITTSSPSDPIDDDLAEPHYFRGSAGDRVEIDMTSEDFDTYLVLVGPSGDEVAQDDDGGTDLNSSLITRLPQNGEYTIWAGSFSGDATGSYNLSLTFV
jgi:serine protease Do